MATKDDFIPIRVSTLRGDLKINFDAYVKVAGKFILYCRKGDSFEGQRLQRLKERKMRQLFITQDSELEYRNYLSKNIELGYKASAGKPLDDRVEIIQGLQQASTEDLLDDPTSKVHYEALIVNTERYLQFLLAEDEALKAILANKNDNASVAHHGVNVAALGISIAQQLKLEDRRKYRLLALGSLLHDIEHHHSGLAVNKPLAEFTESEKEDYLRHPEKGVERLQGTPFYDRLILSIVKHHHENIGGDGFPDHLRESALDEMVLIASVADAFERLITYDGQSPKDAIKNLMLTKIGYLKIDYIQALAAVLKERGIV